MLVAFQSLNRAYKRSDDVRAKFPGVRALFQSLNRAYKRSDRSTALRRLRRHLFQSLNRAYKRSDSSATPAAPVVGLVSIPQSGLQAFRRGLALSLCWTRSRFNPSIGLTSVPTSPGKEGTTNEP